MEYENVDEDVRYKQAVENVKKIAKAIKSLRIKYYPNFERISEKDKDIYDKLQQQMEKISQENGLDRLRVALMGEISAKYDEKANKEKGEEKTPDDILQACYGAIDSQQFALSQGKLKQAKRCQEILKKYLEEIEQANYIELITNYKREKLRELIRSKDVVNTNNETWKKDLQGFCKLQDAQLRQQAAQEIESVSKEQDKSRKSTEKTEEVELG